MTPPLRRFKSLKTKLSIVIVAAVGVAALSSTIGLRLGWPIWVRPIVASLLALVMVQFLARGMTRPLRVIDGAARQLSGGDYAVRVEPSTSDEIGRLAKTFNEMATELEAARAQRRRFIADAAHELRTPVAGLLASTENLLDGVSEVTHDELSALHAQCQRLSTITKDLLDLSRLEAEDEPLTKSNTDVGNLVRRAVDDLRRRHVAVQVDVQVADDPILALVNPDHLHRATSNLLENAAVHGRVGDEAAVIAVKVSKSDHSIKIEVLDEGPGLGDDPHQAFERFHRRAAPDQPGTGLGLAITREVVHRHRGTIEVRPSSVGAHIALTLPTN